MKNGWKCTECFKSDSDHLPAPKQPKNKVSTAKPSGTAKIRYNPIANLRNAHKAVNREIKIAEKEDSDEFKSEIKIEDDEEEELEDQIPRFVLPQMESEGWYTFQ